MKKKLAIASIVLMATSLTACGGDDSSSSGSDDYCSKLSDAKADLEDLDFTGMGETQFSDLQNTLSDVGDSAPSDVKDDWSTLNDGIAQFKTILSDAGLSLDDLQAITEDPTNLPDGVSLDSLQELGPKLEEFSDDNDLQAASDRISANAKSECNIDLDGDASTDAPAS